MGRMTFSSDGKLIGVDGTTDAKLSDFKSNSEKPTLKTSDSLEFLKDDKTQSVGDIFSKSYWSLYSGTESLKPLRFTNGKTQEDIVREINDLAKEGHKVIFLHGTCGSGKSAIALNLARALGKASIVVPVKALQRQYEEDYISKKYLYKPDGKKMKIAMITGKENHDSIILKGKSCADPTLPENIKIVDKNYGQIMEYVKENPYLENDDIDIQDVRRITIAGANPYWSPIIPARYEPKMLADVKKRKYKGANGEEYIFYHRKSGCSYYDQYLAYLDADAIIFNSAKYRAELALGRKPLTEIDIIDEADEFLDSFFSQEELDLTIILAALKSFPVESVKAKESIEKLKELVSLEDKNKRLLGVQEDKVFNVSETKIKEIFNEINSNPELEAEIALDELNYLNKLLETANSFKHSIDSLYATFRKRDDNLLVKLVSTDISGKFQDLLSKTKTIVFMSGTLHSENIIKNIFGIKDFKKVQAEHINFGSIEIGMTGKEFDCKHTNLKNRREDYLKTLSLCMQKAKTPILIHVHAFSDLPKEEELDKLDIANIISSEKLKELQREDKTGKLISNFKEGKLKALFTTKCGRGVDFPGETCNTIIFTKYPNPNVGDSFWKVLQQTHPSYYWEFYKDKAWREFLQKIYRALRSPTDHVTILSPDIRVLDSVKKLQLSDNNP